MPSRDGRPLAATRQKVAEMHANLDGLFARPRVSLEFVREYGKSIPRVIVESGIEDQPPNLDSLLARA